MGLNDPKTKSDSARIDRGKLISILLTGLMLTFGGGITVADPLEDGVAAYQRAILLLRYGYSNRLLNKATRARSPISVFCTKRGKVPPETTAKH